jgi:hypothetical protein
MRRTTEIATTLPGYVLAAQPGEFEVTTTHDLQTYLCAEAAAAASYSKASDVRFDWSYPRGMLSGEYDDPSGAGVVLGADGLPHSGTTSSNAIAQVSSHRLVLQRPYVGPEVRGGLPRVLLQTSLVPSGRTANAAAPAPGIVRSVSDPRTAHQLTSSTVADHLTALCAHPTYPFLIAGARSDKVTILNPVRYRLTPLEIEVSSRVDASLQALEDEERALALQAVGDGAAVQSWRRVLPRLEGEDPREDPEVEPCSAGESAEAAEPEAEALRTLLPGSLSEEVLVLSCEDPDQGMEMEAAGATLEEHSAPVDLTAESDSPCEAASMADLVTCGEARRDLPSEVTLQTRPVDAHPVLGDKRGLESAAEVLSAPQKSSKTVVTSSAPSGKLVLERTQPRPVSGTSQPSESRAKLPLFASSRPQASNPGASSHTSKPVSKAVNPFAVPAPPPLELKRNLLSTLARAKENVPAVVAAAAPVLKAASNTAGASMHIYSAKAVPAAKLTGSGSVAKTPDIAKFFTVKK